MPDHASQVLQSIMDLPAKYHSAWAVTFGIAGAIADKVIPDSTTGWAAVLTALTGLVLGLRALRREAAVDKRKLMLLEAQIQAALDPVKKRQRITEKAVNHVRKKQVKIEHKVKGLEDLKSIGLLDDEPSIPTILVVDDDPSYLATMVRFLNKNMGDFMAIVSAATMEDALVKLNDRPQILIVDLKMGSQSGLDLVAPARILNPNVKVRVITGHDDAASVSRADELCVEVWRKPTTHAAWEDWITTLRREYQAAQPSGEIPTVKLSDSMIGDIPSGTGGDGRPD